MLLKSSCGICSALVHAVAVGCAVTGLYFFFASSIESVAGALLMVGGAFACEVIATVIGDGTTART